MCDGHASSHGRLYGENKEYIGSAVESPRRMHTSQSTTLLTTLFRWVRINIKYVKESRACSQNENQYCFYVCTSHREQTSSATSTEHKADKWCHCHSIKLHVRCRCSINIVRSRAKGMALAHEYIAAFVFKTHAKPCVFDTDHTHTFHFSNWRYKRNSVSSVHVAGEWKRLQTKDMRDTRRTHTISLRPRQSIPSKSFSINFGWRVSPLDLYRRCAVTLSRNGLVVPIYFAHNKCN